MTPMLIQIQRWLMQPKVWRFVGFASTVVGLFCYALSSSFNHLFGEWNLLKIFLYIVFSFFFSLMILFAKLWQHSPNLRFKAQLAVLVLTITSVYSFFFDKAVNGKPDAYSLISCAAFAIMSLSLSRQIHCGFEVDLLYFFLGSLIIQLMKIKLLLAVVGAGFSYFLIILRSSLDAPSATEYPRPEDYLLVPVDSLQAYSRFMNCIKALKKEGHMPIPVLFHHVQSDPNLVMDALRWKSEIINDLREAVELMLAAGFKEECCHLYSNCRSEFLQECMSSFGLQDTEDVDKMERIQRWITASNIAFKILFPNERRLCDRIFDGFSSAADLSFMEVCKELTIHLLNFANICPIELTILLRDSLRVFETLDDLIPEFKSLFSNQYSVSLMNKAITTRKRLGEAITKSIVKELENRIRLDTAREAVPDSGIHPISSEVMNFLEDLIENRVTLEKVFKEYPADSEGTSSNEYSVSFMNEAITIRKRLGEATRGIFMKLENLIRLDTAREAVPDGGVHPITRKVMGYLHDFFRARDTLEKVFKEYPADSEGTSSSLSVQIGSIIELLESNLEANSKRYTDPALGYVFMMNNGSYIKQIAEFFMGNEWVQKYAAKVRQNLEHYQRSSWHKVLDFLKLDNNESVAPNVAAESMKEKLILFNMHFKEICRVQSRWCVSDKQLRKEIIRSLDEFLVPAYGNFIGRFYNVLGRHADEHIKYGLDDITDGLEYLFYY